MTKVRRTMSRKDAYTILMAVNKMIELRGAPPKYTAKIEEIVAMYPAFTKFVGK